MTLPNPSTTIREDEKCVEEVDAILTISFLVYFVEFLFLCIYRTLQEYYFMNTALFLKSVLLSAFRKETVIYYS